MVRRNEIILETMSITDPVKAGFCTWEGPSGKLCRGQPAWGIRELLNSPGTTPRLLVVLDRNGRYVRLCDKHLGPKYSGLLVTLHVDSSVKTLLGTSWTTRKAAS